MPRFYVYQWVREDKTPYYIGKGTGRRAWQKHKHHGIPERDNIIIIAKNLYEYEAFILEKKLISLYGRVSNTTGILWNFTDGGEGPSGNKQSLETKLKMSESRKGFKHSEESIKKMRQSKLGTKFSEESKEKMRLAKLGKSQSEESKLKRSIALKGIPRDLETIKKITETKQLKKLKNESVINHS